MDTFASSSAFDRSAFFRECAARRGLASPVVVEKDFWVCWVLKRLFRLEPPPRLLFKGGTSLSKCFGLIDRFSEDVDLEDVDLAIDRGDLGFGGEKDPLAIPGTKARERALEELTEAATAMIGGPLLDRLRAAAGARLALEHSLELDAHDPQTILFAYPPALDPAEYGGVRTIQPIVRLELGARSDPSPAVDVDVRPYVAEDFAGEFEDPACRVRALAPERTFWEKATVLHAENQRSDADPPPPAWSRGSRHAYDLTQMARRGVADGAIENELGLLAQVAAHKSAFFAAPRARYDLAKPGTLQLVPRAKYRDFLRRDYQEMESMFFGARPTFDEILTELTEVEARVNARAG